MENIENKILTLKKLEQIIPGLKEKGKKIVHCHGVFDLLHHGHLLHFNSAKKLGNVLVVTITADKYVNKGPNRPRFYQEYRAEMLAALSMVDYVAINDNPRATQAIQAIRPDYYVKGPDYRDKQKDVTGGIREEEDAVKAVGGELVFTSDNTHSSTSLINQFFSIWDKEESRVINTIKKEWIVDEIVETIDSLSGLKVLVVGEPIVDSYVFCQAESLSSKSPTVSARFLRQEDYAGGSLAIANHLAELGCYVTLLITHGGEDYFLRLLKNNLSAKIEVKSHPIPEIPTVRKTRFVTQFQSQRIFELINLQADQWLRVDPKPFCQSLEELSRENDLVIAADFGHGMFENSVLDTLKRLSTFIALNVQTNSGNFGFNPFIKHTHYDYLSIDERECRIAAHDRFTPIMELAKSVVNKHAHCSTSITLGTAGSVYFDKAGQEHICPTFFKDVIDTTGAGDAYFALTSLLVKQSVPAELIPFLGNCFAGLKTRIIGNKRSVSKVDLIKTVRALLS